MPRFDFLKPRYETMAPDERKIENRAQELSTLLETTFSEKAEFTRTEARSLYGAQQWEGIYPPDQIPTDFDRVMAHIRDSVPHIKEIDGRFLIFPEKLH